ncbi:MAG: DUF1826 domain-containing protein [Aquimonas sp.]|nr:DUF1826 domain-containing protein [Aquimonas sp.]
MPQPPSSYDWNTVPCWRDVLEGRAELGVGSRWTPSGLGQRLAEGPDCSLVVEGATAAGLGMLCARFCTDPGPQQSLLEWLIALTADLQALAPEAQLRPRLERLRGPGCPRLHVDQLALRLLCTLQGPGTEWLPAPVPDRAGLLRPGQPQIQAVSALQRVPTGAPALLRGERFPDQPGAGAVHRSPPAVSGQARVLLAIDLRV